MSKTRNRMILLGTTIVVLGAILASIRPEDAEDERSPIPSERVARSLDGTTSPQSLSLDDALPSPKSVGTAGAGPGTQEKPYSGIYPCAEDCSDQTILNDPLVAADALEAAWMEHRGFPTAGELEWARNASAEDVERRAEAEDSNRLRLLALWRRAMTSNDIMAISQLGAQIGAAARRERLFYGLYLESDVFMRAFDLAAASDLAGGRLQYLQRAAESAKLAVMLGDTKAVALYGRIPHAYATPMFWGSVDRSVATQLHVGGFFPQDGLPSMAMVEFRPNTRAEQRFRASRGP